MASGEVVLQALANQSLGHAYHAQGDYRRAIDCFRQTMASLEGARRHERFGRVFLPAVQVRAHLAWCHAELGTFAEGRALGEEGLRIAEAVAHPASLMHCLVRDRSAGPPPRRPAQGIPPARTGRGHLSGSGPPGLSPLAAAALGTAYTVGGRVADAVSLLTQAMEQACAMEEWTFRRAVVSP